MALTWILPCACCLSAADCCIECGACWRCGSCQHGPRPGYVAETTPSCKHDMEATQGGGAR